MTSIITLAETVARNAHAGQVRKYTLEPYVDHCREVVQMVQDADCSEAAVAAAWLHDTLEDTTYSYASLKRDFGDEVAGYVWWLTDDAPFEAGNRALRKELYRQKLRQAPPEVQSVKLADLISNARSIFEYDPNFAPTYAVEMDKLLDVLTSGHTGLYTQAMNLLISYHQHQSTP